LRTWVTLAFAEISLNSELAVPLLTLTCESDPEVVIRAKAAMKRIGMSREQAMDSMRREMREVAKTDPEAAKGMKRVLKKLEM